MQRAPDGGPSDGLFHRVIAKGGAQLRRRQSVPKCLDTVDGHDRNVVAIGGEPARIVVDVTDLKREGHLATYLFDPIEDIIAKVTATTRVEDNLLGHRWLRM